MTTAPTTVHPATNGSAPFTAPPLRRRRLSRLLLLGVALGTLGALLGAFAYREAGQRTSVVAVARPVPFGQVIERADLREVPLPTDTELSTVEWDALDSVIGRTAMTDLIAGQTLPPDAVADHIIPASGEAVVGMSAEPSQLPATPLGARDAVLVVNGDPSQPPLRASVLRVGEVDAAGRRTVDLLVVEGLAAELARSAAADGTVLVLVSRR